MAKRPTNDDNKNIQLELLPTEDTKLSINVAELTRKHYKHQSAIVMALYKHIARKLQGELTVSECKQLGDLARNLGIWTGHFQENLTMAELKEAESIVAMGGEVDFSKMSVEELLEWA